MKLKCIITDDEPLAVEGIARYINEVDFLECIAQCSNPVQLDASLKNKPADLIFLDIQMPLMNGLDFLKMNKNLPMVILTTAYPNYALEGYNFDVVDYLVKPITFNRFYKAVTKARDFFQLKNPVQITDSVSETDESDYFFVKADGKYEKIAKSAILYVQAVENYVNIVTTESKFMTLMPLKTVESFLGNDDFIRTHKSFLVAVDKITTIENHEIKILEHRIPVSRNQKEIVLERILKENVLKKRS